MSHSVRFLALAIAAWAGVRAVAFSFDPGQDALAATIDREPSHEAAQGPSAPAPALSPVSAPGMRQSLATAPYGAPPYPYGWMPMPPGAMPSAVMAAPPPPTVIRIVERAPQALPPMAASAYYPTSPTALAPPLTMTPMAAPVSATPRATLPIATPPLEPNEPAFAKALRLHGWTFYRDEKSGAAAPGLAPAGQLGGSQVGARLLYRAAKGVDLSARATSSVGTIRGSEAALGVRVQPFANVPLAVTAERRERIDGVGRSAFSLFGEYGVYGRPLPARFSLDAYAQAGVVGLQSRDWFVDGQLTATRPFWRGTSLGGGVWTASQPGLSRVDVGPRLSLAVPGGMKLHADYRFRVAGEAAPDSGAAITLAGDF